jgi:hypothetical protein
MSTTNYMFLTLPVVTVTIGPDWANQLNLALTAVDAHDHTTGYGKKITPLALNINSDLTMGGNNLIGLRSLILNDQTATLAGASDLRSLYAYANDLYYNNGSGTPVRITNGGDLNASSIGGIGGDYGSSTALAAYYNTSHSFVFTRSTGIGANLDSSSITIREPVSSAEGVKLKSPTSLAASYNWIFPAALPGAKKILTLDNSGNVASAYDVDGATLEINSNTIRVKDLGIITAKINDLSITTGKIADANVTPAKLSTANLHNNYIQNAEFRFYQRQTPATLTSRQNDTYGPDRWYMLTSGGAVNTQCARVAEIVAASPTNYVGQFRQADGTARRFGTAQILENERVIALRGKTVTFSFYARTDTTEITTLRAGVIEWTGTADTVTSDVVSSWNSTPTLIANAAFINTPADLTTSSAWAQYSITITLGATFNNLVLFIWTPNTEAQNDDFYLTQVQLVEAPAALSWSLIRKSYEEDYRECARFYEKSYDTDVLPGTATAVGECYGATIPSGGGAGSVGGTFYFKTRKRITAGTVSYWDINGASSKNSTYNSGTLVRIDNLTNTSTIAAGMNIIRWQASIASQTWPAVQWAVDAEL